MTKVIYADGPPALENSGYDRRQVESVKLALARFYAVDLRAQAQILNAKYGRQIMLHFYLPDGRVFLPFKLRESRIRGDACYGYIDLNYVARLLPGEYPQVMLRSGSSLPLFCTISTARLYYFIGLEILADFFNAGNQGDLDVVHALAVMKELLNGQSPASPSLISRKFRVKFMPTHR